MSDPNSPSNHRPYKPGGRMAIPEFADQLSPYPQLSRQRPSHQRSHSHNSNQYLRQPTQNQRGHTWQQLIPPMPKQKNDFLLDLSLNFNNDIMSNQKISARRNRHSTPPSTSLHNSPNDSLSPDYFDHIDAMVPQQSQHPSQKPSQPSQQAPSQQPSAQGPPPSQQEPSFPFHQTNTFAVRPNEAPPFIAKLKIRSLSSIKRDQQTLQNPTTIGMGPPQRPPLSNKASEVESGGSSNSVPSLGTPFQLSQKKSLRRKKKVCKKCGLDISGQFVRALNSSFHVDCFCCNECGNQCSSKFFPYEVTDASTGLKYQVALCEYDYFKKLDLICFNCNTALRGPYITALGNKYHLEHFKCNVCQKVFESDESYYEHNSNIYCHYHYSKSFANHCEGCDSSIVKQFVELFRGGRTQQWHPECYMVNKFWNVVVKKNCVGFNDTDDDDEKNLTLIEQMIESLVLKCWVTLSSFEELTASSISDMLLNACIGNQFNGLVATGKLVVFIEVLFSSIDHLVILNKSKDSETVEIDLKKEPRNLTGKVMSYLAILRKSNHIDLSGSGSLSSELLSVITGCAHYLKLLIRIGLQTSLKINQIRNDSVATESFLKSIKEFEKFQIPPQNLEDNVPNSPSLNDTYVKLIQGQLSIPDKSTDLCVHCKNSIEKSCIKHNDLRWHKKCFKCSDCKKDLTSIKKGNIDPTNEISCLECGGTSNVVNFEEISDLNQLTYLLKIAFLRSKQVMALDYRNKKLNTKSKEESQDIKTGYSDTLNDVTRMRTKRQNHNLSNSLKKNARKSVIIDAPEAEKVEPKTDDMNNGSLEDIGVNRNNSVNSFIESQDDNDIFVHKRGETQRSNSNKRPLIRDEPVRNVSNSHLNRTSDLLKNEKSLTLDDIPRIVAAEQARDQRPNAFKHHNSLYQRQKPMEKIRPVSNFNSLTVGDNNNQHSRNISGTSNTLSAHSEVPQRYYSELEKPEHFILRHIAVEALSQLTNNRYNKIELLLLIQTRKATNFWDKFKFHSSSSSDKINGVFGVDLQDLTKKYGIDSDLGVGPSKLRIPIVVDDIINSLKTKDMSVEGIFRLNGNIKKLKDLTTQINDNPVKSPDFTHQTAVQLAALMKKWLRELPNPLLTFNLYDLWIETQKQTDPKLRKRLLKLIYCMLPRSHRNSVEVLLSFFNWVSSFAEIDEESGSKMDIHNLATVISPNILYSKNSGDQANDSYFLAIEVVNQLIEMHEELSYLPTDLLEFFELCNFTKTETISTKEIMNKIEKISKENPNFFIRVEIKDELNDPLNQEVRSNTITRGLSKVLTEHHGETGNV